MPLIYAVLCAALVYVAILSLFGRRMICSRWAMCLSSLSLALAFCMLALGTAGVTEHGQYATITRAGFIGYGISLAAMIGQYWWDVWHNRKGV